MHLRPATRRRSRIIGVLAALVTTLVANLIVPATAQAAIYYYKPSHQMNWKVREPYCTGGWGIRSNIGNSPYFLTAAHCFNTNTIIFGWDGPFGEVVTNWKNGLDSGIVAPYPNVDGWQEIPGVGLTVGKFGDGYAISPGNGIAMQGRASGRTYGTSFADWSYWNNGKRVACATYPSQGGDSGAPVFAHNEHGVYAIGVHVGQLSGGRHCYITIDDLLREWNAWLPVFPPGVAKSDVKRPDIKLGPETDPVAEAAPIRYIGEPIHE